MTKDGKKLVAGVAAGVVLLAILLFFALFKVDTVLVVGSTRYSDEEIRQMALDSPLDTNTLLAVLFHSHIQAEDIAFVESFDLERLDSHTLRIHVNEKQIVGYVVKDDTKMYFDKDGYVVESEAQTDEEKTDPEAQLQELETLRQEMEAQQAADAQQEAEGEDEAEEESQQEETQQQELEVLEPEVVTSNDDATEFRAAVTDVPMVLGITTGDVLIGQKISVENDSIFNTILGITRMVEKYQILPECVFFDQDYNITMVYNEGRVHCQLGQDTLLEEKITRVAAILPKLENQTGILHLEDYAEDTTNIIFSQEPLYTLKLAVAQAQGLLDDAVQAEDGQDQTGDTSEGAGTEDGQNSDASGEPSEGAGTEDGQSSDTSGEPSEGAGTEDGQDSDTSGDTSEEEGTGSGQDSELSEEDQTESGTGSGQSGDRSEGGQTESGTEDGQAGTQTGSQSGGTGEQDGTLGQNGTGVTDLVGGSESQTQQ